MGKRNTNGSGNSTITDADRSNSAAHLRSLLERIIQRTTEKNEAAEDIKEMFQEAKSAGHDVSALRLAVKRYLESDEAREKRELIEQAAEEILSALGEFADSPLGAAAVRAAGGEAEAVAF